MNRVSSVVSLAVLLVFASLASAQIPLSTVLSNLGFEDDATTPIGWVPTIINRNYTLDAFQVNPSITPLGAVDPVVAPAGANFAGVLNVGDHDRNGNLAHEAVLVDMPAGTTFAVTVWGVRGRMVGASSPAFTSQPSQILVTLTGWGPGPTPTVNPLNNRWSRTRLVSQMQEFTAWGTNGTWQAQTMLFTSASPLAYVTLGVSCINHIHDSFCAVDFE